MTRRMIEIEPGSESWNAWIEYHRGSRTELVMIKCRHDAAPFMAWTEFPPDHNSGECVGQVSRPVAANTAPIERSFNVERDVEAIAERLEAKAARDSSEMTAADARSEKLKRIDIARERAAAAVQVGNKPKVKDVEDLGFRMIDDPYEVKNGRKPKPLRAKLVNLRDDPIGQMAKRDQVKPDQLEAARRWQAVYDIAASVGSSGGGDPFAMKVDGGGMISEPVSDAQFGAMKRLQQIDAVLGTFGAMLVRHMLGERMPVGQVAAIMGYEGERGANHAGERLRECLDTLVVVLGVEVKGKSRRLPNDAAAELSRFANNPLLYQAVNEARRKIV
jgi:hypothetical protein